MIGNPAIVFGVASILLAFSDGAVLPGVLPHSEIKCHCYSNAATARRVNPVCGTDGLTYQNMCIFICYQKINKDLNLKHVGKCIENVETFAEDSSETCYCTKEINPVCGTDGKTYKNRCLLNCRASDTKDLKLKHHGICGDLQLAVALDDKALHCPCTREINPVCGSDTKTYPNFCILNCHSSHFKDLKLKHHGACEDYTENKNSELGSEDCQCSIEIDYVCGTNSKTYRNLCTLKCDRRRTKDLQVELEHHGACDGLTENESSELENEDCFCSKEINHVCGTDSKTYQNLCILNCRSRDTKDLKMKHHGACKISKVESSKKKNSTICFCSKEINHVCGTDSKTYQNLCILNCHSRDTKDLKLSHLGHCDEKSPIIMN